MERNKDEAIMCKDMAEKKLKEGDITGAKKFALKAEALFPTLDDDLSKLLKVINFYDSYEKKINGEVNWYGILGVDHLADDDTLCKEYKGMALALHPDKNKSFGAEEAFKLLIQAYGVLFDKEKKLVYDLKLNFRASDQNVSVGNGFQNFTSCSSSGSARNMATSVQAQQVSICPRNPATTTSSYFRHPIWPRNPNTATGSHHMTTKTAANFQRFLIPPVPMNQTPACNSLPIPSPSTSRPETFWTSCNQCRVQYEFLKIFLNRTLLCPQCQQPFLAKENPAPRSGSIRSSHGPSSFHHQNPGSSAASGSSKSAAASATKANQTTQRVQSVHENLKRGRKEAVSVVGSEEALQRNSNTPGKTDVPSASENSIKKRRIDGQKGNSVKDRNQTNLKSNMRADESTSMKEFSQSEHRMQLMRKAKTEILQKLNEWSIAAEKENSSISRNDMPKTAINDPKINKNKCDLFLGSSMTSQPQPQPQKSSMCDGTDESTANVEETVLMSVPDANFFNFDEGRVEASFYENQVWALYDDDDGMPRYYALIQNVISRKPFKLQISWLNSKSTSEFGPQDWVSSGFTKTSGYFRIGKPQINKSLSSFSHQVKWSKGARGAIHIFPAKGEVWALYRNWSADWNEHTEEDVIHKYDVVVIIEDYNEEKGVVISPLIKVAGFTSVFRQPLDPIETRTISREEMFRFSHQVPSYMLTGHEAQNVPEGSRDLDPAALPLELLQLTTEPVEVVKEAENPVRLELLDGSSEAKDESSPNMKERGASEDAKHVSSKPILKYSRRGKKQKMAGDADHAK